MDYKSLATPCYIINEEDYLNNINIFKAAFEKKWTNEVLYGYSVKTNHIPYLLKLAVNEGFMAEVVSPDEYDFAKMCGVDDNQIIYNGPQKRATVLDAIKNGSLVNVDNMQEVELVCNELPETCKNHTRIGLRINFDLERICPGETTCGDLPGRFGISIENGDLEKAIKMFTQSSIKVSGIHMHSSSKTRSLKIFEAISVKAVDVINKYSLEDIEYIDIGGGFFGGNYFPNKPSVDEYADTICSTLNKGLGERVSDIKLVLEPGAAILATSMDYLTSVLNIRDIRGTRIVTVDGSLLHINPMMNQHEVPFTGIDLGDETEDKQIIAGSTCMELDRIFPRGLKNNVEINSQLLFHACGAYMSTHNSNFINAMPSIYIKEKGERFRVLRNKDVSTMIVG